MIWKQHHSWSDGASSIAFILALSDVYDTSALIKIKEPSFFQKVSLFATLPYYIPIIVVKFLMNASTVNPLYDGERNLSGRKLVSTSQDFLFNDLKNASKKLKVSLNDLVTACLSTSIKQYFEESGDKTTE